MYTKQVSPEIFTLWFFGPIWLVQTLNFIKANNLIGQKITMWRGCLNISVLEGPKVPFLKVCLELISYIWVGHTIMNKCRWEKDFNFHYYWPLICHSQAIMNTFRREPSPRFRHGDCLPLPRRPLLRAWSVRPHEGDSSMPGIWNIHCPHVAQVHHPWVFDL